MPASMPDNSAGHDPLDAITWVQYRNAFKIAAMALSEITQSRELANAQRAASDALGALSAEVRRFDDSEPSWEPPLSDSAPPGESIPVIGDRIAGMSKRVQRGELG